MERISRFSNRSSRMCVIVALTALLIAMPALVNAGDHWLSRVIVKNPGEPDTVMSARKAADEGLRNLKADSRTVFDITISLEANPQGDDDATVNGGIDDADQRAYEDRIKEFANAVYQSTNGAHKIRKVTIFRDNDQSNTADIRWENNCASDNGPWANPSGFGEAGKQIHMCTTWSGSSTMSSSKGGGYTMAHEWGHYVYGLYDEYAQEQCDAADIAAGTCSKPTPRGTDTAAIPSIMNNQWYAASGNVPAGYTGSSDDFLEFSTKNIHPYKDDSTGETAHKRVFGESGWDTLTRDSKTDPKFSWLPPRMPYSALTAPVDPNWIVNDDESTALSELDIRWVGDQVVDLCIDVSGSMSGAPLTNAKTGANLLIDRIQPGTALGVSSFATDVARNFAITDIDPADPDTVRNAAKTAVNNLSTSGSTSMYDGLIASLSAIQAFDPNRVGVVYVLSDGGDNDSTATLAGVTTAYAAAGVPIIAFAYGVMLRRAPC